MLKRKRNNNEKNNNEKNKQIQPIQKPCKRPSLSINTSAELNESIYNCSIQEKLRKLTQNEKILGITNVIIETINNGKISKSNNNIITKISSEHIPFISLHHRKIKSSHYNVAVYKYTTNTKSRLFKFYNYNYNIRNPDVESLIIKEIAYQLHVKKIGTLCENSFGTSEIYNYGRRMNENTTDLFPYDCIFFIEMDFLPYATLYDFITSNIINNKILYEPLCNQINKIMNCMQRYGIYHNDMHSKNILVRSIGDNYYLYIIDFGESSNIDASREKGKNIIYTKEKLEKILHNKTKTQKYFGKNIKVHSPHSTKKNA